MTATGVIRVGKIVGCHGLKGEMKIRPNSEEADWADNAKKLGVQLGKAEAKWLTVASVRFQGPLVVVRFNELIDRTAAEPYIGAIIFAESDVLVEPETTADEYWADDIIGLTVIDEQTKRRRGVVKDLLSSSGSDYLEIQIDDVSETVVVPFINKFFPTVDLAAKTVSVDLLGDFLSAPAEPVTDATLGE